MPNRRWTEPISKDPIDLMEGVSLGNFRIISELMLCFMSECFTMLTTLHPTDLANTDLSRAILSPPTKMTTSSRVLLLHLVISFMSVYKSSGNHVDHLYSRSPPRSSSTRVSRRKRRERTIHCLPPPCESLIISSLFELQGFLFSSSPRARRD